MMMMIRSFALRVLCHLVLTVLWLFCSTKLVTQQWQFREIFAKKCLIIVTVQTTRTGYQLFQKVDLVLTEQLPNTFGQKLHRQFQFHAVGILEHQSLTLLLPIVKLIGLMLLVSGIFCVF